MEGRQVELIRPALHVGQQKVVSQRKRYNVIRCGARWGKSTLAEWLEKEATTFPFPSAYYAPTYRDLQPMWDRMRSDLEPITVERNESQHFITVIGGAQLDFWSLENPDSSRGRKYKRVVIDEAAKVLKLDYAWNRTIRPRLVDLKGDAWFLSTGRGVGTYFHRLFMDAQKSDEWSAYTGPSFENPYLSEEELGSASRAMDDMAYRQEILGEDVEWGLVARFYEKYERGKHSTKTIAYDPTQTLGISIDFNVDPMTAIAYQTDQWSYFYVLKEFRLPHSEIYGLCKAIRDYFEVGTHVPVYRVTGDPSGRNRHAGMRENAFDVIRGELGLGSGQVRLLKSAPTHADSRTFTNAILQHFPNLNINPQCEWLIKDMEFVLRGLNRNGQVIILKDENMNPYINMKNSELNHLADSFRYAITLELKNFINIQPQNVPLRPTTKYDEVFQNLPR